MQSVLQEKVRFWPAPFFSPAQTLAPTKSTGSILTIWKKFKNIPSSLLEKFIYIYVFVFNQSFIIVGMVQTKRISFRIFSVSSKAESRASNPLRNTVCSRVYPPPPTIVPNSVCPCLVVWTVFYPEEGTSSSSVEMVDMRTKKLFLRKIKTDEVSLKDLYIGMSSTFRIRINRYRYR